MLTYSQALEEALRLFARDGRLDMKELADNLAVSRATLYRVVSSREQLLGNMLWSLADLTLQRATADTEDERGLERVLRVGAKFRRAVLSAEPLQAFARAEPFTLASAFLTPSRARERVVDGWKALLTDAADDIEYPVDPMAAAEIIVLLGTSMLCAELVAARESETDLVAVVVSSLLSGRHPAPEG